MPVEPLAGKVVIDTNNYYPQRDGQIAELDDESTTTAELLQAHLPASKVVKAFNHIYAAAAHRPTARPPARRTAARSPIAGDDDERQGRRWPRCIDEFGFDTVDAGPLAEGWRYPARHAGYGPRLRRRRAARRAGGRTALRPH